MVAERRDHPARSLISMASRRSSGHTGLVQFDGRSFITVPIDAVVSEFGRVHHCPSIAWGVVRDGRLIDSGGYGTAVDGRTPTPQTVYRIASMTKSFTSAAVLLLRDEGVLRLDDPIATHAPELAAVLGPTSDAAPITLGALLSMASGLATDDVWADRHLDISDAELDEIAASGGLFASPTGTAFEYSNLGFAYVGRIVLRATGRRVQDIVADRFLEPLGMRRTSWVQPEHDEWARPLRWQDGTHVPELPIVGDGSLAPMGGIWSCVEDLAAWVAWFDDALPARDDADHGPLIRSSRREMQQIHRYAGVREIAGRSAPTGYGYGLLLRDDPLLGFLAGHSGGLPGYGSNMRWAPGRRLGVVALANTTYAHMAELTLQMLDALHEAGDLPVGGRRGGPLLVEIDTAARRLVDLLNAWDDRAADELFTDNVAPDESYERRRSAIALVVAGHGPLAVIDVLARTDAAADVHLQDRHGDHLLLTVELAPLRPSRIESFELTRPATKIATP